jgi:3-isopropylmalate dehydratase small subunit
MEVQVLPAGYNYSLFKIIYQHIKDIPPDFNMSNWDCGSSRCIAGWACYLMDYTFKGKVGATHWYYDNAVKLLNISEEDADELFYIDYEVLAVSVIEKIVAQSDLSDQKTIKEIVELSKSEY